MFLNKNKKHRLYCHSQSKFSIKTSSGEEERSWQSVSFLFFKYFWCCFFVEALSAFSLFFSWSTKCRLRSEIAPENSLDVMILEA